MPDHVDEKLLLRFVREVPRLVSAGDLGVATSGVVPWPHQLHVVRRVVERFPHSFLFCDEVGLGKTVEAALALRQLWLQGRVRRALVLVPRAVLRQWHEELHEKAVLPVVRFDGGRFVDVSGRPVEPARVDANPWNRHDLVLASSQLARGRDRRRQLLGAEPWDLAVIDEAHHARRRQLPGPYRPNRLLELLAGSPDGSPGLRERARALYLLTATPMQIHPLEVFDLLRVLGLGGRWGGDEGAFLGFFEQLRRPFTERDWTLLLDLASEAPESESSPVPAAAAALVAAHLEGRAIEKARQISIAERPEVDAWLRRRTPIHDFVWRYTRPVLRRYRDLGLLTAAVPERRPRNVWIELSPSGRALYLLIEAYLTEFYQRYEARRPGLGFVMTVFRRRLTSSFRAVRKSLERRRASLLGGLGNFGEPGGGDPMAEEIDEINVEINDGADDLELPLAALTRAGLQQELRLDAAALPAPTAFSRDELAHLEVILRHLVELEEEPKLRRLEKDLRRIFRRRDRVLVFTQYLDTLDQLREALRADWSVACYSGRGGEVWRDGAWQPGEKEPLKEAFGRGEIQILLCTEAASEGLNLQTCGVLINYDMPWNPMQVEQRIGRIDRIGQRHKRVWIRNYFYADTVEATIYQRLADRIDGFRSVVGELQPILHRVGEAVEKLAMTPESRRRRRLEEELADLRRRLDDAPPNPVEDSVEVTSEPRSARAVDSTAEESVGQLSPEPITIPVTPRELERLILESTSFGEAFSSPAGAEPGIHILSWAGEQHEVTFEPKLFAERPYSLGLLTWGSPLFEQMLASLELPSTTDDPSGLGLYRSLNPVPVSVFVAPTLAPTSEGDGVVEVKDLETLRQVLAARRGRWSASEEGQAASLFTRRRRRVLRGLQEVEAGRRKAEKRALRATAGELLVKAASLELLAAENPGLFDRPLDYGWGEEAVLAQQHRPGPYARLLQIAEPGLGPRADDQPVTEMRGHAPEWLARRALEVEQRGHQVAERWTALTEADEAARRAVTDLSTGMLERLYFPLASETAKHLWPPRVEPPELQPFRNAIPLWPDLATAAQELADALAEGRNPLAEVAARHDAYTFIALEGRVQPAADLFATPIEGHALEPRAPHGSIAVFRLDPTPPREGQLVLVEGITDPETGSSALVRLWKWEKRRGEAPRLVLAALAPQVAPVRIEEPEESTLRVLGRLVDVISR